ncbi:hypothetical protein [Streptomyces sp. HC307]|uniref:hypothetical protein n=1 Tax=Streptomyces flavusporus TaxID=3385496 RepID=UPI0039172E64
MTRQPGWASCPNCQGLHFAGHDFKGACPAGGQHSQEGTFGYEIDFDVPAEENVQHGWASCPNCKGLHFAEFKGTCPAGGQHSTEGSFAYALRFNVPPLPGSQPEWNACPKCQSLFFGPFRGKCPADGETHSGENSFNYVVPHSSRLQFRLRGFRENQSTDDFLQGGDDEIFISATGLDSSSVRVGPDGKPVVNLITAQPVGDVSEDSVRGPWGANPHALIEFDLLQQGDFPRTYTTTLFVVEQDNGDLQQDFQELHQQVGGKMKAAVVGVAAGVGAGIGAAVGSAVPGIGTAVGGALGALAGAGYDGLISVIDEGLQDEIFTPIPITLTVDSPWRIRTQPDVDSLKAQKVREHDADYDIVYDWHVV